MSEPVESVAAAGESRYLVGIRLREPLAAEDCLTTDLDLSVGEFCVVESGGGTAVGEVRRPRREREVQAADTCSRMARARGLALKIVDVAIEPSGRRYTVSFNAEERV